MMDTQVADTVREETIKPVGLGRCAPALIRLKSFGVMVRADQVIAVQRGVYDPTVATIWYADTSVELTCLSVDECTKVRARLSHRLAHLVPWVFAELSNGDTVRLDAVARVQPILSDEADDGALGVMLSMRQSTGCTVPLLFRMEDEKAVAAAVKSLAATLGVQDIE